MTDPWGLDSARQQVEQTLTEAGHRQASASADRRPVEDTPPSQPTAGPVPGQGDLLQTGRHRR